ncbi:tryptophan aminotransferase-related protein 4-like [Apium graveolens]|uniref:tryptophan aminotransferase-related protein 4-like n=1 Tax=Apium graveolens TaxID=4045 RepID=UPI003D7AE106
MNSTESFTMRTLKLGLIYSSLIFNVFIVYKYLDGSHLVDEKWSKSAAGEAEAVAAVSCSGHGRAYLDGIIGGDGTPVCECNACFTGLDCFESVPECVLDADSGNPIYLEPFWMKHAASTAIVVSGWHRMGYEYDDGSLISQELRSEIFKLHDIVKNVNTTDRYIIFGAGSTQLLGAAVHSLSLKSSTPTKVVASVPYYPVYKSQTELLDSTKYKFTGDASIQNTSDSSTSFIEFVTSPNNPDGQLKKAVLKGSNKIHDLAYYWPHYSPIVSPVDEDIAIFTLSKLTGHAGSRFGWALIKDKDLYQRMVKYMDLNTYGVSRETQLRALKLLKHVVRGGGQELFEFGYGTMKHRWELLSKTLQASKRFSVQHLSSQYCTFLDKHRTPSPAFAWIKCEQEEDEECSKVVLGEAKVIGRAGSLFGAGNDYVRVSLADSQDHFNILLNHIEKLVSQEKIGSGTRFHFYNTANQTWHANYQFMGLDQDIQCSFDGSSFAHHQGAATIAAT